MESEIPSNAGRSVSPEPWRSKQWIANFCGYSTRWVERQVVLGMPHRRMGGQLRFQPGRVDDWQRAQALGRR